ncbi:MAG: ADP-forming succinate--CoA ligase subunit beta, partial [Bacteroidales bacterium]|nr:ADP-forming succinate--CoA ligase subunit beta [Bacteroidales bacterium]
GPEGKKVSKVLIEQGIYYPGESEVQEFYISVLLNRGTGRNIIMYSTEGGMDIETVAEKTPHLIYKEEIDPKVGIQAYQARKVAFNLGLSGNAFKQMVKFVMALYSAYEKSDASMFEINPVFKTSDNKIFAADAKVNIDDNALYRHPEYAEMRDISEEDPAELEAGKYNLNFVKLDGNVGCMVNGAGLAMATMDIIKLAGGDPANFLDVGGSANAETVEAGFRIILKDPNVKAILINIFGGIVRCDRVAQGVVDAYNAIGSINIPVIVRLQGTNAEEGKQLIDASGLKVYSAITLQEAADLVKELV